MPVYKLFALINPLRDKGKIGRTPRWTRPRRCRGSPPCQSASRPWARRPAALRRHRPPRRRHRLPWRERRPWARRSPARRRWRRRGRPRPRRRRRAASSFRRRRIREREGQAEGQSEGDERRVSGAHDRATLRGRQPPRKPPGRARLLLEALQAVGVTGDSSGEHLHRDVAAEPRIAPRAQTSPMPPAPSGAGSRTAQRAPPARAP